MCGVTSLPMEMYTKRGYLLCFKSF